MATQTTNIDPEAVELALQLGLDPVRNFRPRPTQRDCLESKARYRWIGGGNRMGKSAMLAFEAAATARRMHPLRSVSKPTTGLILAPSREQLQDPWEKKLLIDSELRGFNRRPMIPPWEIDQVFRTSGAGSPTIRQINLKNGNIIRFGVSKDPESWKRRAGQQLAWIILDEAEGNTNLLNELYPRLLDANKDPDIVAQAGGGWLLWGATPTTSNTALMKFIADCQDPAHTDWQAFLLGEQDSDSTDLKERERLRQAFSSEDYEVRMRGTGHFVDRLLIYGHQWHESDHMRPQDYIPSGDDQLWAAYDPGGAGKESHDSGIMICATNRENPKKLRVIQYFRTNGQTLSHDVKLLAHHLRGRSLEGLIPDPAINKAEKGSGRRLRDQLTDELRTEKITVHRGLIHVLNRHDAGIKQVQTYLEQRLIEINPSFDSGGQIVRQQLVSYRSFEPGMYSGARGVVKVNDEAPDCLRYIVQANPRWTPGRGCGEPAWQGKVKPIPQPVPQPENIPEDQKNYRAQLERSRRLTQSLQPRNRRRY